MKGLRIFVLMGIALSLAMTVFGQPIDYEILRDVRRQQQDSEAAAAREQELEKSEHVRETMKRPLPITQQKPIGERLQERLIIIQDEIIKLHGERSLAVKGGKNPEEIAAIDAKIAKLHRESVALKAELGLVPEEVAGPGGLE